MLTIRFTEIIDRIWITVPLDPSQFIQCESQLWNEIKARKGKPKQVKGGWRGTFYFGGYVSVGITVAKLYGHRYLQYDLKPKELNAIMFEEFLKLGAGFPGASYANALTNGTVSYLEVATDFLHKDTADLLIHKSGAHGSFQYFPWNGTAPSTYAGAAKSASKSAAYTKTKPFILCGKTITANRARIERRVRYLGLSPMELGGLKNLFADVHIFSISAAEALTNHQVKDWTPFLKKAKAYGVASALAKFPKSRKPILALLQQARVPWWEPATYMAKWDQTVARQLRLPVNAAV